NVLFAFAVFAASAAVWGVQQVPPARIVEVDAERLPPGAEALAELSTPVDVTAVGDRRVDDWTDLRTALQIERAGPTAITLADGRAVALDLPASDSLRQELAAALEPEIAPIVGRVEAGTPAERAGLVAGDRVVQAAGQPIRTWQDLLEVV